MLERLSRPERRSGETLCTAASESSSTAPTNSRSRQAFLSGADPDLNQRVDWREHVDLRMALLRSRTWLSPAGDHLVLAGELRVAQHALQRVALGARLPKLAARYGVGPVNESARPWGQSNSMSLP